MGNQNSQQIKYGEKLDNDMTLPWKKIGNNPFPARDGHCACGVGNKLFVFGGVVQSPDGSCFESNKLLVFHLDTEAWTEAEANGAVPEARSAATMAVVGGNLFLFGGLSQESGWFDGVFMYNIEKKSWSRIETTGSGPCARDKLASAVIDDKIYIFGGFGPQSVEEEILEEGDEDEEGYEDEEDAPENQEGAQFGWFNDLHIFDPATKAWSSPMQMNLGVPTPRAAHAMCAMGKKLIIFGGRDAEARRNDIHVFDTETRKWQTDLSISGRQPEPRSFHTATTVDSRVVVIGGRSTDNQHFSQVHIFDTAHSQWLQPTCEGDKMEGRGVHTATVVGDHLVVYGGSSNFNTEIMQCLTYHNDVFTIKTADIIAGHAIPSATENQENISQNENIPQEKSSGKTSDKLINNGIAMESSN